MDGDIAVCGGGIVGTSLALKLAREGFSVLLFDRSPPPAKGSSEADGRAFALSLSSCRLLEAVGLAELLRDRGQRIRSVRISDGRAGEGPGPAVLEFNAGEIQSDSLGCMIADRELRVGLAELADAEPGIKLLMPAAVSGCSVTSSGAVLYLSSGQEFTATAVAGCDGRTGPVARWIGPRRIEKDYGQSAIVCAVAHELPHDGVAQQFFMPPGPLAILPMPGCMSSIVWTESTVQATRLASLPEDAFMRELRPRFGDFLGALQLAGDRQVWPLTLSLAETIAVPRAVLVGESAHGLHPLAGQGLNVGLRDVAALTDILVGARRRGEDFGSLEVLRRHQERRRIDAVSLAAATDFFNWIYSNDSDLLRAARGLGMSLVGGAPWLRRALIRQAAGLSGTGPGLVPGTLH